MAMTKAEKAEMERLRDDLAKAKALRWPDYQPEKLDTDLALKETQLTGRYDQPLVKAWCFDAYQAGSVNLGCFTSLGHNTWSSDDTTSKERGGPWFPTKRDALMALRIAKTDEFAAILAKIDRQIAEAD